MPGVDESDGDGMYVAVIPPSSPLGSSPSLTMSNVRVAPVPPTRPTLSQALGALAWRWPTAD